MQFRITWPDIDEYFIQWMEAVAVLRVHINAHLALICLCLVWLAADSSSFTFQVVSRLRDTFPCHGVCQCLLPSRRNPNCRDATKSLPLTMSLKGSSKDVSAERVGQFIL